MKREEIKEAIEDLDEEVLLTIIDCCKELNIKGMQMCFWDKDSIIDVFDTVWRDNNDL